MSREIYDFLLNVNVLSAFVPLFALILTKNETRRDLRRVLYFLVIAWLIAEGGASLLARNGFYNIWLQHFYFSFSTIGYLIFFHLTIPQFVTKKMVYIGSIVFVIFIWTVILIKDSYYMPVTINTILTFSIPLLLSVLSFYHIAKESKVTNLLKDPIYWVNCAILIHFGIGLCANLALEFIVENRSFNLALIIWPFGLISNIIHNIVFSVGVWKTNQV